MTAEDVVVGFVPNNNIYCLALALALYLFLYAEIPFPGTSVSCDTLSNDSGRDMVLHRELTP